MILVQDSAVNQLHEHLATIEGVTRAAFPAEIIKSLYNWWVGSYNRLVGWRS